ncbi:MAG: hypothetical protein HY718_12860, partial [Planctomycetes bacterium]|nr:hypothetical protein [Planctomycetota bacterium]
MMAEFRRLIIASGVMCHYIDMADLYACFDRRITSYNFLRFSERQWRWLNNDLQYLNRLRITDYRRLHVAAGFEICQEVNNPGSLDKLATVPLAPEFRHYPRAELAVRNAWIVSRPTARP